MIVVSDTSPITNLTQINRLDLLPKLYGAVTIPQTVADELARFPHSTGFNLLALVPWLTVRAVHDTRRVASFRLQLDQGESEALVLCQELQADLLLIDERKGRRVAAEAGIPTTGLLGVLLTAKQRGLLPSVKAELDALARFTTFRCGEALAERVLREAGE